MHIDVSTIKVYLVSPGTGKYKERAQIVFQRLLEAGYKQIEFFRSIPAESGTNSLTLTNLAIFEQELKGDRPFMILEDDCQHFFQHTHLTIPDDTDVLYTGVSSWVYPYPYATLGKGYHIHENTSADIQDATETVTRINGMTGGHAILFLNREYIRQFMAAQRPLLPKQTPHDLVYATMHKSFHVYALKQPMFYQDKALGGQESVTKLVYNGERYVACPST